VHFTYGHAIDCSTPHAGDVAKYHAQGHNTGILHCVAQNITTKHYLRQTSKQLTSPLPLRLHVCKSCRVTLLKGSVYVMTQAKTINNYVSFYQRTGISDIRHVS